MDRRQLDALHEQASEHYIRGEYPEAVAAWRQILEFDPDDEKALEALRVSSRLDQSASAPPPEGYVGGGSAERLRSCLAEVESRIDSGDLHGAMRAAELLRVEHPDDPSVLSVLAKAYSLAGESDKAAEMMAQFLASSPEYAAAAALLEECRQVSPHESQLGSVIVRDDSGHAADQLAVVGTTGGVFAAEAESDDLSFDLDAPEEVPAPAAEEEKGLAIPESTTKFETGPQDPSARALRDRVSDLLRQARAARADGRHEEALGFVSRILILDDGNDEAMRLEDEIRKLSGANERELERLITEGAHLFDLGRHEEARQIFLQVLEKSPNHREGIGYLERVDTQLARASGGVGGDPPRRGRVWGGTKDAADSRPADEGGVAVAAAEDLVEPEGAADGAGLDGAGIEGDAAAVKPRVPFTLKNIPDLVGQRFFRLIMVGAVAIMLTVGFSWWFSGDSGDDESAAPVAQVSKAGKGKAQKGRGRGQEQPPAEQPAMTPAQKSEKIAAFFAQGEDALARKDYEAAIVAYDEIARLDPENTAVRAKILAVGEDYKKWRADALKLEKARELFAEGEYQSALRMIYRLPDGMLAPDVWDRYKIAGWYNLGVVALRGANCTEAVAHLNEARALAPKDPEVKAARDLADRCRAQSTDRSFYNRADSLTFRALDPPATKAAVSAGSGAGR